MKAHEFGVLQSLFDMVDDTLLSYGELRSIVLVW